MVYHGIAGHYVMRVLDQAERSRDLRKIINTDQGPEIVGKAIDRWAYEKKIDLRVIQAWKLPQRTPTRMENSETYA